MTLKLVYYGFNYPAFDAGAYGNGDTLAALAATGSNSVALEDEYGIDAGSSKIVVSANYTDSTADLLATIKEAKADGQSVMVRPLIDFLDPGVDGGMTGDYRSYFNPSNPSAFFSSYQTILVQQAEVAQQGGAASFCIGTELDQLTGPQYLSEWTGIINAVRAVFSGKLTYSAEWDDALSPWQYGGTGLPAGTGNIATQVSFWSQIDYVGIDEYAPLSDAANPTLSQLVAGWEQTPTDPTALAVTGDQSLISYFDGVSAEIGKPLFFTEIGYEDATDAASQPFGTSTNTVDQPLQTALYQAFFTAWSDKGTGALAGANFWNWDPDVAETAPADGANFSPQSNPAALQVIDAGFAMCFCPGTRIRTPGGEVAVEALAIGDPVMTAFGGVQPVKWIGRRAYSGRFVAGQVLVSPVCIKAGALDSAVPARDLWVSPGHGIYLDGALVPAWRLVNGVSVLQPDTGGDVDYLHIELGQHEVIFAEGCPAESFLDTGGRSQFHNAADYHARYPDAQLQRPCAGRVEDGFHLQAIQQRIAQRAGVPAARPASGPLLGYVDQAGPGVVSGWAQSAAQPEQAVCLDVLVDGARVARILANRYRADLRRAGLGSGAHGFEVRLPPGTTGRIEVRRSADQAKLRRTAAAA